MGFVTVVTGPAHCGKTTRLLSRYRQALAGLPGSALWLAPTQRSAAAVRRRLLDNDLSACLSPGVMTFDQFAASVLRSSATAGRPISALEKRRLVASLLKAEASAGRLRHFAAIADKPGLVDLVSEWISELKRLEIWPEEFRDACQRRTLSDKDRELVSLYEAYQRKLTAHDLYDAEGRFWAARARLREGQRRPFEHLRVVVADGFADFTRTQHEVLEILAERTDELWISLPLEEPLVRRDLFAKPLDTLARLARHHPDLKRAAMPRRSRGLWPALGHLEQELFKNPREQRAAESVERIEILAAARELGEIEQIGRFIKRLLVYGDAGSNGPLAPDDLAVVFRSLTTSASAVREVFDGLGIPYALEAGRRLDRSPALAALVALLRLASEDWPFRRLLAVLSSNYFQPAWPAWQSPRTRLAIEQVLHRLRVPAGRDALLTQVRKRATKLNQEGSAESLAVQVLEGLAAALGRLPRRGTFRQWSAAITALAHETGLAAALRGEGSVEESATAPSRFDQAAWSQLERALTSLDELAERTGDAAESYDLKEALAAIEDILASVELPPEHEEPGRVRILSAASARGLQIPYLFCAGLSEKAFPPAERHDRLYNDSEIRQLSEQGLPLVHRHQRSQEEMLLFYELVNRATQRLYLSYPALDEKAQPLLASPFLAEVEQACRQPDIPQGGIKRRSMLELKPIPQDSEPASPGEWRVMAVDWAMMRGEAGLLAGLAKLDGAEGSRVPPPKGRAKSALPAEQGLSFPGMWPNVLAGLELTRSRGDRQAFGPFEGMLVSPAIKERLAREFADRTWSPVQLERYQECPFKFYATQVLGIEPLEEIELETDYAERGVRLHETLVRLHRRIVDESGQPGAHGDHSEFARFYTQALQSVLAAEASDDPLERAMLEIDRRVLAAWGEEYLEQHHKYDDRWRALDEPLAPAHFEASFGPQARRGESDQVSRAEPLTLERSGERILISGRIDRIDVGQAGGRMVFNVVDYKSGSPVGYSKHAFREGKALQLPLYAMAVEKLLLASRGAVPWQVGYWFVKDAGFRDMAAAHEPAGAGIVENREWEETREMVVDRVFSIVSGIRHGDFPVYNEHEDCTSRCELRTVCRVAQVRSLEKAWLPTRND
jgi:ATP-dependent helicase/nuclease subunit B